MSVFCMLLHQDLGVHQSAVCLISMCFQQFLFGVGVPAAPAPAQRAGTASMRRIEHHHWPSMTRDLTHFLGALGLVQTGQTAVTDLISLNHYVTALQSLMQLSANDRQTRIFLASDDASAEKEIGAAFPQGVLAELQRSTASVIRWLCPRLLSTHCAARAACAAGVNPDGAECSRSHDNDMTLAKTCKYMTVMIATKCPQRVDGNHMTMRMRICLLSSGPI